MPLNMVFCYHTDENSHVFRNNYFPVFAGKRSLKKTNEAIFWNNAENAFLIEKPQWHGSLL